VRGSGRSARDGALGLGELRRARVDLRLAEHRREVVPDRRRQDEVAVREPLHERRGAETVRAVVGEVRLADREEARDGRLQLVVDPQAAHRVVRRRVDAHRDVVGVLPGDALVHVEQVPVLLRDDVAAEPADRLGEVEVDAVLHRTDAVARVDPLLRRTRGDVARREVPERRVAALEEVVAVLLGDVRDRAARRGPSGPRCGRRCAATPTSASASTGTRRSSGWPSGGSA
jgi:hypothetical protein